MIVVNDQESAGLQFITVYPFALRKFAHLRTAVPTCLTGIWSAGDYEVIPAASLRVASTTA